MPELPEVEAARKKVESEALNRTVETVSVTPDGMTLEVSEGTLREALLGHRLTAARRHGKHLFIRSGEERHRWLRLHLGMTGEILVLKDDTGEDVTGQAQAAESDGDDEDDGGDEGDEDDESPGQHDPEHDRLRLDFAGDRSLVFRCPRKLGEVGLVDSPESFVEEKGLGPDLLSDDVDLRDFREVLDGRRGTIKSALMNQEILAGLGNEYSDEALYQAEIHPDSAVTALSDDDVAELWRVIGRVLEKGIEARSNGDPVPSSWLLRNREEGRECPRCGGTIRNDDIAGRSSYFCPDHQEKR
ncbi:MAG: DNA-formamidopyrimidine glycosylase family protein [Longimicrobiales bacterium]|nr:DNA-formamidopyrimidine glycosylase family protein [Longimicrobiales bacterium]